MEAGVINKEDRGMLTLGVEGVLGFILFVLLWVGSFCGKKWVRGVK